PDPKPLSPRGAFMLKVEERLLQDGGRIFYRLYRCPDIASVDLPMVDKKGKLIAGVIMDKQTVIRAVGRDPVQVIEQGTTHIRGDKEVTIVGQRVLLQPIARARPGDDVIGEQELAGLLASEPCCTKQ